jgi:hypothetical protein
VTDSFIDTIFTIFHKDLCLTKKSARCVPQLLTKEKKNEREGVLPRHSYSPDFSPADFFLFFPEVEQPLANVTLALDTFRSSWERAIRTITIDEFAVAYRRWIEGNKKCIRIGDQYVEKS